MAITLADFNKIWASTSPLTPYSFSEANYKRGWNFIGSTPPARQMWDSYMKASDEKHQWLYNNKLSLSGGTMTGEITSTANNFVKRSNDAGYLRLMGGTELANGASLTLLGIDHSAQPGQFMLRARDASIYKDLLGKPDGTLTWDGNTLLTAGNYSSYALPLSGGTMTGNIAYSPTEFRVYAKSNAQAVGILGGADLASGAALRVFGKDHATSSDAGSFYLTACDANGGRKYLAGKPDGTLTWGGKSVFYGTITTVTGGGYEINSVANIVKMWTRINMAKGATATWTFPVAMANTYYCRYACNEDGNSVALSAITETSITVQNNGTKNYDSICILIIGTPAS